MSSKPLVAIVGRPNVGKSTFFNKITGGRSAIVKNTPGVTRDRIYRDAEWCGYKFTLIDTGGIEMKSTDEMFGHIRRQAEIAIETADVTLFFVDGKEGLVTSDFDAAVVLRNSGKPVILVVNKMDNDMTDIYDFYRLGLGEPFAISSEHSLGVGDLLDEVVKNFDKIGDETDRGVKIAIVGKPNAGKSSLTNKLLGFERVIVSDIAGTTRDAIDTPFTYNDKNYTLIDTAGIRRKRAIDEDTVEAYSVMRAFGAIRRADVVFVVIDCEDGVTEQDVRIAGYVHEQGKPSVIVMNKWDLVEKDAYTIEKFERDLKEKLSFMDYFFSIYVSAKSGQRVEKILSIADKAFENSSRRITTGLLNEAVTLAVATTEPPSHKGRRLKIYYVTQAECNPPTFIVFVNDAELMHFSYLRYLENSLRKAFDFSGTPVKLIVRQRDEEK